MIKNPGFRLSRHRDGQLANQYTHKVHLVTIAEFKQLRDVTGWLANDLLKEWHFNANCSRKTNTWFLIHVGAYRPELTPIDFEDSFICKVYDGDVTTDYYEVYKDDLDEMRRYCEAHNLELTVLDIPVLEV